MKSERNKIDEKEDSIKPAEKLQAEVSEKGANESGRERFA